MAHQVVAIALVLFVVAGMAFAENAKVSAPPRTDWDGEPDIDDVIGTNDDDLKSPNTVLGTPIGGPDSPDAFAKVTAATGTTSAHSATSAFHVSTFVGVTSTVLTGYFYF